jgi:pSer/pThr/pTyr-binding forkhead associated (FHA) protein
VAQSPGKLVLILAGGREKEYSLARTSLTLGRATTSDIPLSDPRASRSHARIDCTEDGCAIVDLGSANGTWLDGARVDRALLAPGSLITLGDSVLRFEAVGLRPEEDITSIESEADLKATLTQTTLDVRMNDTAVSRLAVHTSQRTWEVPLTAEVLTIGRSPENDVHLDDSSASRRHARLERRGDAFVVRDLGSTNGTWVGSQRIDEHQLHDGDTIRIGTDLLVFKRGFSCDDLTLVDRPSRESRRSPVVVVPGLMGSELWRGSEMVWPNARSLLHPAFMSPEEPLEARGLVGEVVIVPNLIKLEQYGRLGDYLEEGLSYQRGKDLLEFAYDWRQDVRLSAKKLAAAVDNWAVEPPITIIAHSLGCLVSRWYVEHLGGKDKVGRLILLGGPHYGAPKAVSALLTGKGLLPFGLLGERLRELIMALPSMYQLLPIRECAVDQEGRNFSVLVDDMWVGETQRPFLRAAAEFRRDLGLRSSVPSICIFGYGVSTITGARVQREATGLWQKVDLVVEPAGDGTVPAWSSVLEGSEIHPVHQSHSALYVDQDVKMRLKMELTG